MKKSDNPIAVRSRQMLMDALIRLMDKKEYSKINVTEIVEEAQLVRKTFYRNYETKDEVLNDYIEILVQEYIDALGDITDENFTLQKFAQIYFEFWQKQVEFLILLDKNDMIYLIQNRLTNPDPIIKKMAGCEQISEEDDLRNCCTAYVAGGFWYVLFDWVHSGAKKSPEDMASLLDKVMSINNKEFFINEYKKHMIR